MIEKGRLETAVPKKNVRWIKRGAFMRVRHDHAQKLLECCSRNEAEKTFISEESK